MRAPVLWLGLGLWCALGAAQAFDIPTPQNQPKSVGTTPFGTPQDFAPVTALPEVTARDTTEGAGHLPDGVTVRTEITVPPEGLLQRAAFLVTLTLIDRTKNIASLTLHRPFGERIAARRISISQRLDAVDGRMANVRVYRFAVTPLSGGEITLNFAEMTFQMVGEPGSHYAFIPVARRLTIRPLPAFWPEYIPVTPTLSVVQAPLPPLNAGEPMDWQLRITGQGLTEHALTQLLDEQLIGTEALALGQAQIRLSPTAPVPGSDELAQTFDIRIPILPDPQGQNATTGTLPALRLPFINRNAADPGAMLNAAVLPAQTLHWPPTARAQLTQAIGFWWWRVLLGLVAVYALFYALRDGYQRHARRRQHQAALLRLAQCQTPQAALHALRAITGEPSINCMIARAPNPRFIAALHALDAACFSASPQANRVAQIPPDWPATQAELVRWLPRAFFIH
ncbi:MAG: hypothetical protein B7Y53_02480 [Halothiobacillus sp. 28-55-5]|nr:MAG: hypothetical protein B7Y53_02480 [Halothiobacillus sp. 28-55-5]